MRLIDADRAYKEFEKFYNGYTGELRKVASEALDILCLMPEVDAVPVVRCKDCKNGKRCIDGYVQCSHPSGKRIIMTFSDFCSFGERRDNDA